MESEHLHKISENEQEQVKVSLFKIWEAILGRKDLTMLDNFFDIGGDSMKAVGAIELINKTFHTNYTTLDLFNYPAIESFTYFIMGKDTPDEMGDHQCDDNADNHLIDTIELLKSNIHSDFLD